MRTLALFVCLLLPMRIAGQRPPPSLTLEAVPLVIIPADPLDYAYHLVRLHVTRPLADGGLLVAGETAVYRFSAAGKLVATFGRKGEGPGEFTRISGFAQCGDGRIVVGDAQQRRLTVFPSGAGKPVVMPLPADRPGGMPAPWVCEGDDLLFLDVTFNNPASRRTTPNGAAYQDTTLFLRGPASLRRLDIVARIPGSLSWQGLYFPYGPRAVFAFTADQLIYGSGDSVIHFLPRRGGTGRMLPVSGLPRLPITPRMKAQYASEMKRETPPARWEEKVRALTERAPWPAALAPVARLLADDRHRLWIQEAAPPEDYGRTRWRVVDADRGNLLATMRLEKETQIVAITGDRAILSETDRDGEVRLVVRRIRGLPTTR